MKNITLSQKKNMNLQRRKAKVRSLIAGTADRPRLVVKKSNRYTEASVVDDVKAQTLICLNTIKVKAGKYEDTFKKVADARTLGMQIADKLKSLKISKIVFDRGGNRYSGRVKAVADGAREGGLEF
ncbi:MAG: 50S ribosomal protein L18 [Candidatus Paceibacterota bacterium]